MAAKRGKSTGLPPTHESLTNLSARHSPVGLLPVLPPTSPGAASLRSRGRTNVASRPITAADRDTSAVTTASGSNVPLDVCVERPQQALL